MSPRRHRSPHPSRQHRARSSRPPRRAHDLGQNDLVDASVIQTVVAHVAATTGPIVEVAAGTGRLTEPLTRLGRPLTAVELDPRRADVLRSRLGSRVRVLEEDLLTVRLPARPHVLVGNLPFHVTTATLRRVLAERHWTNAALIMQWEAARRRAGVGGASLLTASWWPWFTFGLVERIPSTAFRPRPAVDAALLTIERREVPLVSLRDQHDYQRWTASIFAVPGNAERALMVSLRLTRRRARELCRRAGIDPQRPVSRISAEQWAVVWAARSTA